MNKNRSSSISSRVGAIISGIPIIVIGLISWNIGQTKQDEFNLHAKHGVAADAEVIAIHSKPGGKHRDIDTHVEFTDQSGIKHMASLDTTGGQYLRAGRKLRVTYLPNKINRVLLEGAENQRPPIDGRIITFIGLLAIVYGLFPRRAQNTSVIDQKAEVKKLIEESRKAYNNPPTKKPLPNWRIVLNVVLIPIVLGFIFYAFHSENYAHTTTGTVVSNEKHNGAREVIIEYVDDQLTTRQVPLLHTDTSSTMRVGQKLEIDYGAGARDKVKLDKPDPIPFLYWYMAMFVCVMILAFNNRRAERTTDAVN